MKRNSHPIKVEAVKDYKGLYANSHPYKVEFEGGGEEYATKEDVDELEKQIQALSTDLSYKGKVEDYEHLPTNPDEADVYLTEDTGILWVYTNGTWIALNDTHNGIPTDATFWGQSYDATNNSVNGDITFPDTGVSSIFKTYNGRRTHVEMHSGMNFYISGVNALNLRYLSGSNIKIVPNIPIQMNDTRLAAYSDATSNTVTAQILFNTAGDIYMQSNRNINLARVSGTGNNPRITGVADPTDPQDAATKNYADNLVINYATINGTSAPTTATEGKYEGQLYLDTTNNQMYYLVSIDDTVDPVEYNWSTLGGGGIPTDATFWGQSYDATSNSVNGNINFPVNNSTTYSIIKTYGGRQSRIDFLTNNTIAVAPGGTNVIHFIVQANTEMGMLLDKSINSNGHGIYAYGSGAAFGSGIYPDRNNLRLRANNAIYAERASGTGSNPQIKGVADPTDNQDVATKHYVDTAIASAGAATYTNTEFNNLWENA